MSILRNSLLEEQKRLLEIRKILNERAEDIPEGTLRIIKRKEGVQYYHRGKGLRNNGTYIPKEKMNLAVSLAQKAYNQKILRYTEKILFYLNGLLVHFEEDKIDRIFNSQHPERQKLIIPVVPTYQQRLEEWIHKPYIGKGFQDNTPVIMTNGGIRVRSKTEKIMADYFESIGLTFKYECPLQLEQHRVIYPDFTFLSPRTGREVYWEHEGMLDNPDYAKTAVQKIEMYEMNGLYPGEDLILTFESSITPVNTLLMKKLTQKYLL